MYCSFRPLSGNYISQWFGRLTVLCEDGRFPSPVGELHFSIGSKELLRNHDGSFRPLSGNYISQSPFDNALNALFLVSVPCRGTTFLNPPIVSRGSKDSFPSPVGELHFSIFLEWGIDEYNTPCFRPLSGNYISQSDSFPKGC